MKMIAILGSTGSIGRSLLNIINKEKKIFKIKLLTARKNHKLLLKQAKQFKVKNVILTNEKKYILSKEIFKKNGINIFNDYSDINKILPKKVDYVMSSLVGIEGLEPTLKLIKYTKNIAIANKETIICGWNLIKKALKKNKTNFLPVDSEHFSVWYALDNKFKSKNVKKIYLTASGGPLLNIPSSRINKINISQVLKHPNWNMGKKISVDSATLMNKVFEIIEAKNIFNVNYDQLDILIHPSSYIHAIVEFKNNMISLIAHDTTMEIPIRNTLSHVNKISEFNKLKNINIKKLNNLSFSKVDINKFPFVKIINELPEKSSLFETALVSANDQLVNLYLKKKIQYHQIMTGLFKLINLNEIKLLKKKYPRKISDIININNLVRSKISSIS